MDLVLKTLNFQLLTINKSYLLEASGFSTKSQISLKIRVVVPDFLNNGAVGLLSFYLILRKLSQGLLMRLLVFFKTRLKFESFALDQ